MIDTDKDIIDEFFDDKYEGLTIDDWYKMNHHDWEDVVNEYNDLLAEVKRLRELVDNLYDFTKQMQDKKRKDPIGLQVLKVRM